LLCSKLLLSHVALVDPNLDANATKCGASLKETEVDVRTQRVQWNAAFTVELGARHFSATKAARNLNADALSASALCGLNALAHCAAERNTRCELLCDALGNELSFDLGVLNLKDVQLNLLTGELLELRAKLVSLSATATNYDAWTCGVDVNANTIASTLNVNACNTSALETSGHHAADRNVFLYVISVTLALLGAIGKPARAVIRGDTKAVPVWVNLLSH
jgi:hypothetical protein